MIEVGDAKQIQPLDLGTLRHQAEQLGHGAA